MSSERLWLFFNFFSFYTIHHNLSFPSLHSSQHPHNLSSTQDPLFHSLSEKSMSLRESTEYSITSWNEARHKPSYQGWTRQQSGEKRVPRAGENVRDTPPHTHTHTLLLWESSMNTKPTAVHDAEDLAHTPASSTGLLQFQ